jgi:hypothetical protein
VLPASPQREIEINLPPRLLFGWGIGKVNFELVRVNLVRGAADPPKKELQVEDEPWVTDKDVQAACAPRVGRRGTPTKSRQDSDVVKGRGGRGLQPVGVQTMRAGGSSPRLTAASTGPRPCVRRACRVSSATEPRSSRFIASRETSTHVHASRPSAAVDRTDHEAQMLFRFGVSLVDSLTLHSPATRSP